MRGVLKMLADVGRPVVSAVAALGGFALFVAEALQGLLRLPRRMGGLGQQMAEIGYFSLPVVGLTAAFSGLVLALQSFAGLAELASPALAASSTPRVVAGALVQELGPVLAGLMIAGRVGAAMAAELGAMRVSEQIDALHTLSTPPIAYLVSPRLAAAVLMLPALVMVANLIGLAAGYGLSVWRLGLSPTLYLEVTWASLGAFEVGIGLLKAAVFGGLIALIATYQGYRTQGGAGGVGRATRNAVVMSSIAILAANYLLTEAFFGS